MEKEAFKALVEKVSDGCPDDHIDWLTGRLMHGNEINLGKRIKKIIEPFKDKLGSSKERNQLLRKIVDTRNYLTLYSEILKDSAADPEDLWSLCQKMEVIYQLHFLKVVGFSNEEIENVVENCYPLKQKINKI